ncbi:MAG: hypothetical protein B6244_03200 [Candidatus Cloacimonetes bacterium 4572_55]|nr:MAG: hypothetical protein B6244_03200 [Candidatus Cloacimonetes bacterium 4572_55]
MTKFHIGEQVVHESLGLGQISNIEMDNIHINFGTIKDYFISLHQAEQHIKPYRFLEQKDVVRHPTYGIGLVKKTSPLDVEIEFTIAGYKKMDWILTERRCTKLAKDGLGRYLFDHRRKAFGVTKKDPKLLVSLVLLDLGREARTDDIHRELTLYGFLEESGWASWWKNASTLLRQDPLFDTTDSRRQIYRIREHPKSPCEELIERFEKSASFNEKFRVVKQVQDKHSKNLTTEQTDILSQYFIDILDDESADLAKKLQSSMILRKLRPDYEVDPENFIKPGLNLSQVIHSGDAEEALDLVGESPGWEGILLTGLNSKAPKIRKRCLEQLIAHEKWEYIDEALSKLIEELPKNGDIFLWLTLSSFQNEHPLESNPPLKLVEEILNMLDQTRYKQKALKAISSPLHLKQVILHTEKQKLHKFLEKYIQHKDISFFKKEQILSVLEELGEESLLSYFSKVIGKQVSRTDLIQLTQEEYDMMLEKFDRHIDVDLIEITQNIAAGDPDSSSYKSSVKRQQLLINRIQHLKQTLKNCRILL